MPRSSRDALLREVLEKIHAEGSRPEGSSDPVVLVRRYRDPADAQVAGWIASAFAYGRVDLILAHVAAALEALGPSPARTLAAGGIAPADLAFFRHRFHGPEDLAYLLAAIGKAVREEGSVAAFFERHWKEAGGTVEGMLDRAAAELARGAAGRPSIRFLFPRPAEGSACKRWNLFLRWMTRPRSPDLGLFRFLSPRDLVLPLDVHLHRIARRLRLTSRRSADWRTAVEITGRLRAFDPEDPVKYDFALCQLGILEICRAAPRLSDCPRCPALPVCATGRRQAARRIAA